MVPKNKFKKGQVVYGIIDPELEIAVKGKIILLGYDVVLKKYVYQLKLNSEGTKNFYERDIMLKDYKPNEWKISKEISQRNTRKARIMNYMN